LPGSRRAGVGRAGVGQSGGGRGAYVMGAARGAVRRLVYVIARRLDLRRRGGLGTVALFG